jgi:UrcA family protein
MSHTSIESVRRLACAAVGVAALSLFATTGHAESTSGEFIKVTKVVRFPDLDPAKQSDAAVLYTRLRRAAKDVCGTYAQHSVRAQAQAWECYDAALQGAVDDVNSSNVTALHTSQKNVRLAQQRAAKTTRS